MGQVVIWLIEFIVIISGLSSWGAGKQTSSLFFNVCVCVHVFCKLCFLPKNFVWIKRHRNKESVKFSEIMLTNSIASFFLFPFSILHWQLGTTMWYLGYDDLVKIIYLINLGILKEIRILSHKLFIFIYYTMTNNGLVL